MSSEPHKESHAPKQLFGYHKAEPGQPLRFNEMHHAQRTGIFEVNLLEASVLGNTAKAGAVGAATGAAAGAAYSWWLGTGFRQGLTAIRRHSVLLGSLGALAAGTAVACAHARGRDDMWNAPAGAVAVGLLLGLRSGSFAKLAMHTVALGSATLYLEHLRRSAFWPAADTYDERPSHASAYKFGRSDPYLSKIARAEQARQQL